METTFILRHGFTEPQRIFHPGFFSRTRAVRGIVSKAPSQVLELMPAQAELGRVNRAV